MFQPTLFSLFKTTLRTLSLSNRVGNSRGAIRSIVLEQWEGKSELSLSKMFVVLTKQKFNSSESSVGFVITFTFHLLNSGVSLVQSRNCFSPIWLLGIFHAWIVIYIFTICIPQCLLALFYFSDCKSERREGIFKWYLSHCQRGAKMQSISEIRLCSIQEARKIRKDSLYSCHTRIRIT